MTLSIRGRRDDPTGSGRTTSRPSQRMPFLPAPALRRCDHPDGRSANDEKASDDPYHTTSPHCIHPSSAHLPIRTRRTLARGWARRTGVSAGRPGARRRRRTRRPSDGPGRTASGPGARCRLAPRGRRGRTRAAGGRFGLGDLLSARREQGDGLLQAAAVGERPGQHDPTLGDQRRAGDTSASSRQSSSTPPSSPSPGAVHQHRVLLDGPADRDVRLELLGRGRVLPDRYSERPRSSRTLGDSGSAVRGTVEADAARSRS